MLKHELRHENRPIKVEPQVFKLLALLISNHHRMVSKEELLQHIWNGRIVSDSTINSRIRLARKALGDSGARQEFIKTVHNRGFCFEVSVTASGASVTDDIADRSPDAAENIFQSPQRKESSNKGIRESRQVVVGIDSFRMLQTEGIDRGYFSDGLQEDIITALSKLPRIRVVAGRSLPDAPTDGGASSSKTYFLLQGQVRRDQNRMEISAQLIEAYSGQSVWSDRYIREPRNILDLHDEMTREIVSALQIHMSSGEQARMWSAGTKNYTAWQALIAARQLCLTHNKTKVQLGRDQAKHAIALDSNYGSAFYWIAYSYWAEGRDGWGLSEEKAYEKSLEYVGRALEIDENDANALALLALVHVSMRDYDMAMEYAEQAIAHGAGNAHVFSNISMVFLYSERFEQAIDALKKAMEYAPLYNAGTATLESVALLMLDRYDEAIVAVKNSLSIDPDYIYSHCVLAVIYISMGRVEHAHGAVVDVLRISPNYKIRHFMGAAPFASQSSMDLFRDGLRDAGLPE